MQQSTVKNLENPKIEITWKRNVKQNKKAKFATVNNPTGSIFGLKVTLNASPHEKNVMNVIMKLPIRVGTCKLYN